MEKEVLLKDILETSLTISEKRTFYCKDSDIDNTYLIKWKNKKNLVTEEILKDILKKNKMDEKEFNFCISPIKIKKGFDLPDWLIELDKILEFYDTNILQKVENKDISLVIFPFIRYVAYKLSQLDWTNSSMKFSEEAIQDILTNYTKQITPFIEKNLVIELEEYKTTHNFKNKDTKQQFYEFIEEVFENEENSLNFFKKYAVSTRLNFRTLK